MQQVIQRIVTSAFRIERNGIEPVFAVRSGIGVVVALLAGFATGVPVYAVAAGIGAFSTGFASLQGVYRTRAGTMLGMAFAMALSTAVASLCSHSAELAILALAVWGFGYGMIAALGPGASAIGVNATTALIIFEHFPLPPHVAAMTALIMFAGGLLQTLLLVVLWPIERYPQERHALADAYRELAAYAQASDASTRVPSTAELTVVRKTLADPRPLGRPMTLAAFQSLLDEAVRIRASLALLATVGGENYARLRPVVARVLDVIARALDTAQAPEDVALYGTVNTETNDPNLRALYGQLRAAWRAASVPLGGFALPELHSPHLPNFARPLGVLRDHLHLRSPFGRHALRLAVTLAAAGVLADVLPIQRGYWITLTAALVLRPDFTTTLSRGVARIAGTIVGVVAATAIVVAVPNTPHITLALAMLFAAVSYAAFQLNYGLFSLTVTAYVVFLLALLGTPEATAVQNRLVATVIGGLLAMASYVIWPTWESARTRVALRNLVDATLAYTRLMLQGLIDPSMRDLAKLRTERNEVWAARAAAEESLERMLSEPGHTHEIDPDAALGIMAASQRLGLANTALVALYQDPTTPAYPQLSPLADAFARASLDGTTGLRDAYAEVASALENDTRPATSALLASCDRAVDSTNTIVELWRSATQQPLPS
ncbi:MAG TPA: FUSC family protein [Candidatus Acidoferrum sp.]|nr:FUSC family protein [Candidatus Acidoferrum sp.]